MKYAELVEKLAEISVNEEEANMRNKLSQWAFTVAYLLECLSAVGTKSLRLLSE